MSDEETEGAASGRVPVLRHEAEGGDVPLDPVEEALIWTRGEPILRALITSVADTYDVPQDAEIAAAMLVSGLREYLTRTAQPFPERSDAAYARTIWLELKFVLAQHGEYLPPDVQEMWLWMFAPHARCARFGSHRLNTRFGHVWESLFPKTTCHRALRQLPPDVIEAGDEYRDTFSYKVRDAVAGIARTIRSRNDYLYAFLAPEQGRYTATG